MSLISRLMSPHISLIAAASENNVIGNKGKIPWHLPADLKHFRELTEGHPSTGAGQVPVIMGRKTYESIGHPLKRRRNIVITRQTAFKAEGCEVVQSFDKALDLIRTTSLYQDPREVFVIGGGQIYGEALPLADRVYLTRVHGEFEGDAFFFFPRDNLSDWVEVSSEYHKADAENSCPYTFLVYERKKEEYIYA